MKFFRTISKNFKLLFRMKTSLLAVILGPLLVVFLIGLAFNSSSGIEISIGHVNSNTSSLAQEFVSALEDDDYLLQSSSNSSSCQEQIQQGILHTCIVFPEDFAIENNNTNEILFIVDKSRMSIVYTVIESVSEKIGVKTEQLSKELTQTLTQTVDQTQQSSQQNLQKINTLQSKTTASIDKIGQLSSNLQSVDYSSVSFPLGVSGQVQDLHVLLNDMIDEADSSANQIISLNSSTATTQKATDLQEYATNKENQTSTLMTLLSPKLNELDASIASAQDKLSQAQQQTQENQEFTSSVSSNLQSIETNANEIETNLQNTLDAIDQITITSSDQIVNPVTTKIETVSSNTSQLTMLFPYVIVLIVMFVGMLLAATLVVIEKKSKAAFRVFTSPTRDEFYILTTFFTALLIVLVQIAITLTITHFFFIDIIATNLLVNSILLVIASSLFIMIGMAIGYLFSTQQGANMACISLGAVLLFISNIVLPLESVAESIRQIAYFNPYVLSSEMLRQAILFQATFKNLYKDLLILLLYAVIIVILIIVFQRTNKITYFKKHAKKNKKLKKQKNHTKKRRIVIHGETIADEKDFIHLLNKITQEEFDDLMRTSGRKIQRFVKKELQNPQLAAQLKTKQKKELLHLLSKQHSARLEKLHHKHKELTSASTQHINSTKKSFSRNKTYKEKSK